MFSEQRGLCAICEAGLEFFTRRLHVDHDHVTGKVRGLLCRSCNLAIGFAKENRRRILQMINYLDRHDALIARLEAEGNPAITIVARVARRRLAFV